MRGKNLILPLLLAAGMLPAAGHAHDGHGPEAVTVDLEGRDTQGGATRITLRVSNYGAQPVVVMGIGLPGQDTRPLSRPMPVVPGGMGSLPEITLSVGVPGPFTIIMDFGPDGPLPVLIPAP